MSFELKFNFNHAWKFLRVSWLAFTGMQMWPWSPRSGVRHYPSLYHESWWFISWHIIPFLSISYYNSLQTIANLFTQPRDGMNLVAKEFVACRFVQLVPTINNIIIAIIFTSTKSYHPLMQDKRAWRSHSLPLCWCWWYDAWGPPRQPIWGIAIHLAIVTRHMTWHDTWIIWGGMMHEALLVKLYDVEHNGRWIGSCEIWYGAMWSEISGGWQWGMRFFNLQHI